MLASRRGAMVRPCGAPAEAEEDEGESGWLIGDGFVHVAGLLSFPRDRPGMDLISHVKWTPDDGAGLRVHWLGLQMAIEPQQRANAKEAVALDLQQPASQLMIPSRVLLNTLGQSAVENLDREHI